MSSAQKVVLLHTPRCSKSRALKAALDERGVGYEERRYLEQPLTRAELTELLGKLGVPAKSMVRRKEAEYEAEGLSPASSDEELLDAVARAPKLMERPVLIHGERAAIGRPGPADALAIL
jgi:arsenate reductase